MTKPLDDQLNKIRYVSKAAVTISDDQGNEEILTEVQPGHYQTKPAGVQGQVGTTYKLHVKTADGIEYESIPQKMLGVGDIENMYYEFKQVSDPSKTDHVDPENGFQIYVDGNVLPEQEGLVRWRATGIFELITFPELRTITQGGAGGSVVTIPDPPACSGWRYLPKGGGLQKIGECTCCDCWVTEYSDKPMVSDPRFLSSGKFNQTAVAFVPASRRLFYKKYYIEVEQMSVSAEVHNFWKEIAKQDQTGSDLFQTPPAIIKGNVKGLNGAHDPIGIFSVSAVVRKSFTIMPDEIPYTIPPIDTIKESCLSIYNISSTTKPPFW
jgi:hypothetical protein